MADVPWNPSRLDVQAFAHAGADLVGEVPAAQLVRFSEGATHWPAVRWVLHGEERKVLGGEAEVWVRLEAEAVAEATCQRCLKPVKLSLRVADWYRFVRDEAQAATLDAELEQDVLVLSRTFNVHEWLEDELLLALPIVPMHETCPEPLPLAEDEPVPAARSENPFAVLAGLKSKSST